MGEFSKGGIPERTPRSIFEGTSELLTGGIPVRILVCIPGEIPESTPSEEFPE